MTTVGRAGEVWFLSMVNWIEYEPFGANKKRSGNLRFKTTVNGYGWTSTRDLG